LIRVRTTASREPKFISFAHLIPIANITRTLIQ